MPDLETYRSEIDSIDSELIALLKRRIGVVSKVGEYKRQQGESGVFIRPGREGKMHQRIFEAFQGSPLLPQAAVAIWRLLISASTHHESPLTLAIMQQDAPHTAVLAQAYFGDFLEARTYVNAGTLLSDVYEGKASIGILPYPQDELALWWLAMAQHQEQKLSIFAKLPVVLTHAQQPTALAVAEVKPEPSGADESYFAFQLEENMSTSRLITVLQQAGIKATILNIVTQTPLRWVLVRLDGFYTDSDSAIGKALSNLPENPYRYLGSHPKEIRI